MGLPPKSKQSFQGLTDHLCLAFLSCDTASSLIGAVYNQSQKASEIKDVFADELQILVRKIVAHKPEFLGKENQALKHLYIHTLREPYFREVARGQCLASPDSESFVQLRGLTCDDVWQPGKCVKVIHSTSVAVHSEEISRVTFDDQQHRMPYKYHRCQNKIDT